MLASIIWLLPLRSSLIADESGENKIKAAAIFNFAKFVEWPGTAFSDAKAPIVFAVLGEDPFGEILEETLHEKTIGGRPLTIKRFKTVKDIELCHVLYVSKAEEEHLAAVFDALKKLSVLTVSDIDKFTEQGGIIRLFFKEKKLRFDIQKDRAKQADLKVSSRLLQLGNPDSARGTSTPQEDTAKPGDPSGAPPKAK